MLTIRLPFVFVIQDGATAPSFHGWVSTADYANAVNGQLRASAATVAIAIGYRPGKSVQVSEQEAVRLLVSQTHFDHKLLAYTFSIADTRKPPVTSTAIHLANYVSATTRNAPLSSHQPNDVDRTRTMMRTVEAKAMVCMNTAMIATAASGVLTSEMALSEVVWICNKNS